MLEYADDSLETQQFFQNIAMEAQKAITEDQQSLEVFF